VAIVVGAGQAPGDTIGNGRAIAILFAREGARVLLVDRDVESAAATQAMIAAEGGEARVLEADVTDEPAVRRIPQACLDHFGQLDVLVNNVGIGTGDGGVTSLERATWDRIFAVNVTGVFLTCKYVVPVMRDRNAGAIVNISSVAAVAAAPLAAYKSSKAALNALTHHLATANFGHGIRVNAIMPGLLDTPMAIGSYARATGASPDELRAQRNRMVPLNEQMGTAWDTAHAALFLASDEAGFITGVVLPVDGGQSARIG
jgi:NAD(P)-dependent dehydrogenase (short-subunit alcohol dehydrogenase family)